MMYEVAHQGWRVSSGSAVYAYANGLAYPGNLLNNNTALYGKGGQRELPLTSFFEEYKFGKLRTVMMLRNSKGQEIRDNSPEVRTSKKKKPKEE